MISIYDVLKASKGIHVDDTFAELWGRKLSNAYTVVTYTGTLPATLTGTKTGYLESYKIYGNTVQDGTPTPENPIYPSECGERTGNLCDENNINQGYYAFADGQYGISGTWVNTYYIAIKGNTEYTAKFKTKYDTSRWYGFVWYDSDKQYISTTDTQANPSECELTATSPANASFCVFNICSRNTTDGLRPSDVIYFMVNEGSTALPYEPYGYKLPLTVESGAQSQDIPIYIGDTKLMDEEYVDYEEQKVNKRTPDIVIGIIEYKYVTTQGVISPYNDYNVIYAPVIQGQKYVIETAPSITTFGAGWFEETPQTNSQSYDSERHLYSSNSQITAPITGYIGIMCLRTRKQFKVHNNSTFAPTNPPAPFPQIPTFAGTTTISWAGEGLAPSEVELTYRKRKGQ